MTIDEKDFDLVENRLEIKDGQPTREKFFIKKNSERNMDNKTFHCSKERELGIMATKIENIDKKTDEIKSTLTEFIKCADRKYATKQELDEKITALMSVNTRQDDDIKWTREKIYALVKDVAIAGTLAILLTKSFGMW